MLCLLNYSQNNLYIIFNYIAIILIHVSLDEEIEEETVESLPVSPLRSATSSRHASAKRVTVDPEPTTMSTPTSRHQSRTSSATTLLASPEINTEESRLVLKSGEEQVDLRKRDKNFLRYHYKVNCFSMHIPAGRSWGVTPRNHEYSLILAILNWCFSTSFAWAQFVKWIGKLLNLITTNLLSCHLLSP